MKQPSLRLLAFRTALISGAIAAIACFIPVALSSLPAAFLSAAISLVVIGVLVYFLFSHYSRKFINAPLRSLYKAIYNLKIDDTQTLDIPVEDEPLLQMQREVTEWMKNRSAEIEDLKKLEIYRREFLGNVSHELKTPIFNIQGYVETLLDGGLEDPGINRNYLQRAEKSVERMINIIDDLESISRLESGELIIERYPFDIYELVMEIYYAFEMKAGSKGIKLAFRDPYKPVYVFADKDRIRQVITNLVSNSIKYGKDGGQTETRFYQVDDNILIEIADNGIGIAREHLPRLFERFYRVDKGRSREQGGTGLGLAIVKHILEAHGQGINVRSSEGIGSTFSFTLPKPK
ncbi:MAG TPA: ATP-binding protein [Bacteroidia bacterium]|nr:ATP-binding protein [Bacteroidia bacterium]